MRRGAPVVTNCVAEHAERRTYRRFSIQAPILFRNNSEHPEVLAGGFSKNVSASGIYLVCEQSNMPRLGNEVAVEVMLPSLHRDSPTTMKLRSTGRVLRLNASNEPSGFAVAAWFGYEDSL